MVSRMILFPTDRRENRKLDRRYFQMVFSESGVAMGSAVLCSDSAVKVRVEIMKAFVEMRRILISNTSLKDLNKVFEN